MSYERPLTIRETAARAGLPEETVRCWCKRKVHPIPHLLSGNKRPVTRIRWERFEEWLVEEEKRISG